jgi:hypothetical protein
VNPVRGDDKIGLFLCSSGVVPFAPANYSLISAGLNYIMENISTE